MLLQTPPSTHCLPTAPSCRLEIAACHSSSWPVHPGSTTLSPLHLLRAVPVRLGARVPLDVAADAGAGGRLRLPCQHSIQRSTQVLACR